MKNQNPKHIDNTGRIYKDVSIDNYYEDQPIVNLTSLRNIKNNEYAIIRLAGGYNNVSSPFILVQRVQGNIVVFITETKYTSTVKLVNDLLIDGFENGHKFRRETSTAIINDKDFVKNLSTSSSSAYAPRIITIFENTEKSLRNNKFI